MVHVQRDEWMQRWLPLMKPAAGDSPVLELGCDTGGDTAWLLRHGFTVIAADIAADALQEARRSVPAAMHVRHDLARPFPFRRHGFGLIIASLCLHYFPWRTTEAAVAELRGCLKPGGLLLCRANSVRDVLHGAGQGEEIEPGYFRQDAHYASCKRFFRRDDVERLFHRQEWSTVSLEERTVLRYAAPKVAWELVARAA